jgi:hypothetical protein
VVVPLLLHLLLLHHLCHLEVPPPLLLLLLHPHHRHRHRAVYHPKLLPPHRKVDPLYWLVSKELGSIDFGK